MLSQQQEKDLIELIKAYQNGKGINELPVGDPSEKDKIIEVFSKVLNRAEQMTLEEAVHSVGGGGGLTLEERKALEKVLQYQPMTQEDLDSICI